LLLLLLLEALLLLLLLVVKIIVALLVVIVEVLTAAIHLILRFSVVLKSINNIFTKSMIIILQIVVQFLLRMLAQDLMQDNNSLFKVLSVLDSCNHISNLLEVLEVGILLLLLAITLLLLLLLLLLVHAHIQAHVHTLIRLLLLGSVTTRYSDRISKSW